MKSSVVCVFDFYPWAD